MAGIHEKKGEYDAALDLKLRSLSLAQDCAEKTGTVQAYETLAASHGTLAFLCRDLGKTEQARFHAMASQEIIETCMTKASSEIGNSTIIICNKAAICGIYMLKAS